MPDFSIVVGGRLPARMQNGTPFPGSGLGIKIVGDVTCEGVEVMRKAGEAGNYDEVYFVLP
ncbi:unnamed protein product [Clonostachys solani]|uniref:Uncharacterized protein n=1 Tax=Clonostachys solani TaxID=160281 RepID=A0A9N9ZJT7_9HYPO|nr:unnamed protein product [Clonostachys solani]